MPNRPSQEFAITQTAPVRPQQSYRHEAFLWRDSADFTAGLVPFVTEGVEAGEPTMVAMIGDHTTWLRDALGDHAHQVHFVDMAELGRNPARIIPAWQQFLDTHSGHGRPVRGIGEPIWAGRRLVEITECQLHEALLNVAVDPQIPFWLVCPYDVTGLDGAVIDEAYRSHPVIVESDQYRGSTGYAGRAHVEAMFAAPLEDPTSEPDELPFGADDLHRVFSFVALKCYAAGARADRAADLAAAVQTLADSSLKRGALGGTVRVWQQPHSVVLQVADETVVGDPLAGRRAPGPGGTDSLWFANQVCDLVQLRSTPDGTTVRIHSWT